MHACRSTLEDPTVGAVGRVLPATVGPVSLEGLRNVAGNYTEGLQRVVGQVAVQNSSGLARLRLDPADPASPPEVAEAILAADQVVLGPGSLFTSVLAAAIVPCVHHALAATKAQRIYVANLAPQVPETEGFTATDEAAVLLDHGVTVDVVVTDPSRPWGRRHPSLPHVEAPVADDAGIAHDPTRLGAVLAGLRWPPRGGVG